MRAWSRRVASNATETDGGASRERSGSGAGGSVPPSDTSRATSLRRALLALTVAVALTGCEALSYMPGTPRPTWCDPTDTVVNDGHTASFHAFYTTPKGPLSQQDCQAVVGYLNDAVNFVAQFPTVADAQAAGWIQATVWTPGQGIHFVDPARETGPFDPRRPNWLQFNGTAPSARLAGMMWLVESGAAPPAGFPGANDHWHNHDKLCIDRDAIPFVIGEHVSDAFCAAMGGVNTVATSQWMVHAWLPKYAGWDATDIFNNNHPSLS